MKKILLTCLGVITLASCNVKNSDEYKTMKAERDSLMHANAANTAEVDEMMDIINEVEANFEQIKEAEKYLTVESQSKKEMSRDTKTRVIDNFEMINEILKKNKNQINVLNQRLKTSSTSSASLKKTIELLNKEMEDRSATIEELKTSLAKRDKQIAKLETNVKELAQNVETLETHTENQAAKIKAQEAKLYTAFYIFGTSKELKNQKVATGGFLSSTKVAKTGFDESLFIKIDIRKVDHIRVFSKKAKLLSDHPKDSYTIEKDEEDKAVVVILDAEQFWSLTKFLVIEV